MTESLTSPARISCDPQTCEQIAQSTPGMVTVLVVFAVVAAVGHTIYSIWR